MLPAVRGGAGGREAFGAPNSGRRPRALQPRAGSRGAGWAASGKGKAADLRAAGRRGVRGGS